MMWHWSQGMGWWMIFGGGFFLLFWVTIIALVIWAWTKLAGESRGQPSPKRDPLEIVKERYARGEISKEEFEQLKRDLS